MHIPLSCDCDIKLHKVRLILPTDMSGMFQKGSLGLIQHERSMTNTGKRLEKGSAEYYKASVR